MKTKLIIIISIFIVILLCICMVFCIIYNINNTNAISNNQSFEHIKLLEIKSHNWGEVNSSSDYFLGKYYEVYRDGNVYTYDSYNKSGKKDEKTFNISIENIIKIENLIKSAINSPADKSASDGTGWTFKYFDINENILGEYTGYIYSNKEFNEILQILK